MSTLPGYCGQLSTGAPVVCPPRAGHPGPHQAHGYGQRVIEEWAPATDTEAGAA